MKKTVISLFFLFFVFTSSFAQFDKGKMYIGTTFDGAGISYSKATHLAFGLGGNLGYMFQQDVMLIGEAGFNFSDHNFQKVFLGAHCRYLIEQNGLFLQGGVRYAHSAHSYNDLAISPEVGYCHFLNEHLTIEPAIYYDISVTDFSDHSCFGVKIGLGWYF